MPQLMKEEFEQSRQHEVKLFQMLLQSQQQQPSTHPQPNVFGPPNQPSHLQSVSLQPATPWPQNQLPVGQAVSIESWALNSLANQYHWGSPGSDYPGNY